jgi:type IV secretion system protein VirD4
MKRFAEIGFGLLLASAVFAAVWSLAFAILFDLAQAETIWRDSRTSLVLALGDDPLAAVASAWITRPKGPWPGWADDPVVQRATLALLPAAAVVVLLFLGMPRPAKPIFGTARYLRRSELNRAGLRARDGLVLGRAGRIALRDADQSHVVLIGPPSYGKTEGFVIPNLIEWRGSFIALDFKGVLYERTARIRAKQGDKVFLFAPGFERSHSYNPLDMIRTGASRVSDIQTLASLLMPVVEARDAHWNESAQTLVAGLISYVLESAEAAPNRSLGTVVRIFATKPEFSATLRAMLREDGLSDFTRSRLAEFLAVPGEEAGSIRSTLLRHLKPWQNPLIEALTMSGPDAIRIDQLRSSRMAVYLVIDTAQLEIFTPVLKLFLEQVNSFVNAGFRKANEEKILFMIDEFYQLGKVRSIISQLPFARDRDIRICLVSQGVAQIDEKFGMAGREAIMASCTLQLFCGFNDKVSVDMVSAKAGSRTIAYHTTSQALATLSTERRRTRNEHLIPAPLLRPEDLYQWDRNKVLVLKASHPPFVMTKVLADKARRYRRLERAARRRKLLIPKLGTPPPFRPSWISATMTGDRVSANAQTARRMSEQAAGLSGPASAQQSPVMAAPLAPVANDALALTDEDQTILDRVTASVAACASLQTEIESSPVIEDKAYAAARLNDVRREGEALLTMFRPA